MFQFEVARGSGGAAMSRIYCYINKPRPSSVYRPRTWLVYCHKSLTTVL